MAVVKVIVSIMVAIISWPIINLVVNYIEAWKVSLPIIINLVDVLNPAWLLSQKYLVALLNPPPHSI